MQSVVTTRSTRWRRAAVLGAAWLLGLLSVGLVRFAGPFFDAGVYWDAWHVNLYGSTGLLSGYLYAPAFAQLIAPLTLLPWPAFHLAWTAIALAAYGWLLAPLGWRLGLPLLVACAFPAWNGNVEWLVALVAVVGLRYPSAWSAILLTKITPGVGLVWFATRRQWRELAVIFAVTIVIALSSVAFSSRLWQEWLAVLVRQVTQKPQGISVIPVPLAARLLVAGALTAWASRGGPVWLLAPALMFANPDIWLATLGVLAAVPRLTAFREEPSVPGAVTGSWLPLLPLPSLGWSPPKPNPPSRVAATGDIAGPLT